METAKAMLDVGSFVPVESKDLVQVPSQSLLRRAAGALPGN